MNLIRRKIAKYIISAAVAVAALSTSAFATTVVTNEPTNVRERATKTSELINVLETGESRTVLATSGSWVKVKVDGEYGYINQKYITKKISAISVKTSDDCNLRALPSTDSEILASVKDGKTVKADGTSGSWYRVTVDGQTGFIHKSNLNLFYSQVCSKAYSLVGSRYVYGTSGPSTFDCSGFTQYVYKSCGKSIPRTSSAQYASAKKISKSKLQAGQLVFFSSGGSGVGHVGLYVGDGYMIHAANSRTGVVKASINSSYYLSHYIGAGYY